MGRERLLFFVNARDRDLAAAFDTIAASSFATHHFWPALRHRQREDTLFF